MKKPHLVRVGYGFAVAALALALSIPVGSATAEPYSGSGQEIPKIPVLPFNDNATWQPAIYKAMSNWNATYSPVYLSVSSSGGSTITATSYSDSWHGYYQACGSSCLYMRLNSRTIAADASNVSNFITSVLVHEYGHALNLAHTSSTSIMNSSRNRNTMTTPSSSDVTNVRGWYPTWPNV